MVTFVGEIVPPGQFPVITFHPAQLAALACTGLMKEKPLRGSQKRPSTTNNNNNNTINQHRGAMTISITPYKRAARSAG